VISLSCIGNKSRFLFCSIQIALRPVSVISPSFEAKRSRHCHLSLLCDKKSIAACVFDTEQNMFVAIKYMLYAGKVNNYEELNKYASQIIDEEFLLRLPYKTIRCIYPTQCSTIVPNGWLHPEQFKAQLELNHTMDDLDEIHHCAVTEIGAECVFTVPGPLSAKLFEKIGSITYVHQSVPLIAAAMQYQVPHDSILLGICITSGFANVALCIASKLKFYNTFLISSVQDLLYFLMLIAEQFKIDKQMLDILVVGSISDAYVTELGGFFDNILKVKLHERHCSEDMKGQISSYFDLLFLMEQCE
jgi:hypothetical protein